MKANWSEIMSWRTRRANELKAAGDPYADKTATAEAMKRFENYSEEASKSGLKGRLEQLKTEKQPSLLSKKDAVKEAQGIMSILGLVRKMFKVLGYMPEDRMMALIFEYFGIDADANTVASARSHLKRNEDLTVERSADKRTWSGRWDMASIKRQLAEAEREVTLKQQAESKTRSEREQAEARAEELRRKLDLLSR